MCIITHLSNKNDCPCCAQSLSKNQLFPNFLLDKLLKKTSAQQISKSASPVEHFRQALQQGCEVSIKELDTLIALLAEKKRKMEQEEAERNMQILLDFLNCLRKQKVQELNEVQTNLQFLKEDISVVESRRMDMYCARDKYSVRMRMLGGEDSVSGARNSWPSSIENNTSAHRVRGGMSSWNIPGRGPQRNDALSASDSQYMNQTGHAVARKKPVHALFDELQECYLQKRRQMNQLHTQQERDRNIIPREGYNAGLADFQSVLTTLTRYSRMRVIAELRHEDLFHSANIVSSIEFDRDYELFATAGVSKCIKVFDFSSVVNDPADMHTAVVEMPTRSKLSCLSWNKFTKNHIASTDYEGIVTVWDVDTRQSVME